MRRTGDGKCSISNESFGSLVKELADAFASEVIVQFPGKANETLLLFCSGEVNRQKVVIMVDLNS